MKHLFLILTVFIVVGLKAENRVLHTLYTKDDGLSQNRVMDIEQDQKGFMWFATWDGLNRFDGKQFRIYKGLPGDPEGPDNNRFLSVKADAFGYLWLLTGNGDVHRFNPETEKFQRLSYNPAVRSGMINHSINSIRILKENKVALLSMWGCYLIRINPDASIGKCIFMSRENGKLAGNRVVDVDVDGKSDVWFITSTGVTNYNYTYNRTQHFFNHQNNREAFRCLHKSGGRLYFGTESGKVWFKNGGDNSFKGNQISASSPVVAINSLPGNKLMLATQGDGLYIVNANLQILRHMTTATNPELGNNNVHALLPDNDGLIWLDVEASNFVYFDPNKDKLFQCINPSAKILPASNRSNIRIIEGKGEYIWLYSNSRGLFACNRESKKIQSINIMDNALGAENLGLMTDAMMDRDGNVWISSGEPRLEKITMEDEKFMFTSVASIKPQLDGSEVRTVFEDKQKRIWVCDKEGKIQLMDENRRTLGWLKSDGTLSKTVHQTDMMVYDMIQDKKGRIWMACKGKGVLMLQEKNGLTPTFSIRHFNRDKPTNQLSSTLCYALLEDANEQIWVGTFGGGLNLIKETNDTFSVFNKWNGLTTYPLDTFPNIRDLTVDLKGIIWVATDNGLVAFDSHVTNPTKLSFLTYRRNGQIPGSLRTNDVHCIYVDRQNNRWFGTFGGGLNVISGDVEPTKSTQFRSFTEKDGLPSNIILSIEEDFHGFLWLFSENSITRFDTKTHATDVYNKDYGLDPVMFAESPSLVSHTGDMYAGTMKGYYRFTPSTVKKAGFTSPLFFTGLYLFDKEITLDESFGILNKKIDMADKIVLKREQSVFSLEFAALDFRAPGNIQYAYKLEPVDNDWVALNKVNRVTFSSLTPGEYTLVIKSTNSEGVWMNNERRLKIVVKPSAWQTGWAITLYAAIGLIMMLFIHRRIMERLKSKSKVMVDKKVVEAKKQFYSDMTQELRIPLMLVEDPVQQIAGDPGLSADSRNNLSIIQRNIDRISHLVNRILDYQKNANRKMVLMVEEIPIGEVCQKLADQFSTIAQERGIRFLFNDESNGVEVYLDKEKFETILHILLTNAIKYTKGDSMVSLHVYLDNQDVVVKVDDEGIGISKEKLVYLFDKQELTDETAGDRQMGIGLGLVKDLVELHGGRILVRSQEGEGTSFELHFIPGKDHFSDTGVVFVQPEYYPGELSNNEQIKCMDEMQKTVSTEQYLFVVVDNPLRSELSIGTYLSHQFRVAIIRNTPMTLSEIEGLMPDFVIIDHEVSSDGGQGLISQLKGNERTCHIPIILVAEKTAEAINPTKLPENVYELISKPFNASYLEARIEHILMRRIEWHERLRKDVLDATSRSFLTTMSIDSMDKDFLTRASDFLRDDLSNSELSVELLISVIGMSKNVFIGKLKSLIGLSPQELIREMRLRRAIELLESGRYNVSEVVIQVGMKDINAFSNCFKQHVGISPNEYKNKAASLQK